MSEIKLHTSSKVSDLTHVTLAGDPEVAYLGYVKRVHISNSSPRGGAYRWEHQAKSARGRLLGQFPTRKEAVEQIVRTYWYTHYGAVEPGSMMEPNPDCQQHFPVGVVSEAVTAWDLLGIAPDFTGGKSVDEYMDEVRGRNES